MALPIYPNRGTINKDRPSITTALNRFIKVSVPGLPMDKNAGLTHKKIMAIKIPKSMIRAAPAVYINSGPTTYLIK